MSYQDRLHFATGSMSAIARLPFSLFPYCPVKTGMLVQVMAKAILYLSLQDVLPGQFSYLNFYPCLPTWRIGWKTSNGCAIACNFVVSILSCQDRYVSTGYGFALLYLSLQDVLPGQFRSVYFSPGLPGWLTILATKERWFCDRKTILLSCQDRYISTG